MAEENETEPINNDLEEAKKQAEEYLNGWKRAKADLINFQKDSEKRQKELIQFANAAFILELLPIYESLKQAIRHGKGDSGDLAKGIEQIKKQFSDFLNSFGVEEIKTVGEKFNPEFHEAVDKRKDENQEEGIILEEIKTGYTIDGKLLEPAKVIING
jgi:molecular chaperone GrpE